ncbi:hypothetical protein A8709_13975 [Paenibacillus pectinilyticus]|uniref:SLH domain-containing protein n=1 Tax=Paenibacillus pectinilyticus TaxID=512399 RepID=A0A1C1A3T9_9BACL|nr:S-layer homology domain-containing protein [Paenibacillus pectinilyticus]OCT15206.1 hypothetical protein A8709_13975 [Paenibacillus pectinilyticus]
MVFNGRKTRNNVVTKCLALVVAFCLAVMGVPAGNVLLKTVNAATMASIYVSTNGNDANPGTVSQPLKTIEAARNMVATMNSNMTGDINVFIASGTYYQSQTLNFTQTDSATNGFKIIYKSYDGPVEITGAKQLTGWSLYDTSKNIYSAPYGSTIDTRELYINDKPGVRARTAATPAVGGPFPELGGLSFGGYATTNSPTDLTTVGLTVANNNTIATWKNISDVELVAHSSWTMPRAGIQSVSISGSTTNIKMKQPNWYVVTALRGAATKIANVNQIEWIENAYELLDTPGEWYLDKTGAINGTPNTFYYIPRAGEDMATAKVEVPTIEKLMTIKGNIPNTADFTSAVNAVTGLTFEGLNFSGATWLFPNTNGGWSDTQNNNNRSGTNYTNNDSTPDGAITLFETNNINFIKNKFYKFGGTALYLESANSYVNIIGNLFCDIASQAINIGDVTYGNANAFVLPNAGSVGSVPGNPGYSDESNWDMRFLQHDIKVQNNTIHDIAFGYLASAAIGAGTITNSDFSHNEIYNIPYSGFHIGYGLYAMVPQTSVNGNNTFQYNYLHQVVTKLEDGGAIYFSGSIGPVNGSEGFKVKTTVSNNYIYDQPLLYGSLYFDEGVSNIDCYNNVVSKSKQVIITKNITNKIHNNYYDNYYNNTTNFISLTNPGTIGSPTQDIGITAGTPTNIEGTLVPGFNGTAVFPQVALAIQNMSGVQADYRWADTTVMNPTVITDKSTLNAKILTASSKVQSDYTAATWTTFSQALATAKSTASNTNATQADIDLATSNLDNAITALVVFSGPADKTALKSQIATAKAFISTHWAGDYTASSWASLTTALKVANIVDNSATSVQADVINATKSLTDAQAGLVVSSAYPVYQTTFNDASWTKNTAFTVGQTGLPDGAIITAKDANDTIKVIQDPVLGGSNYCLQLLKGSTLTNGSHDTLQFVFPNGTVTGSSITISYSVMAKDLGATFNMGMAAFFNTTQLINSNLLNVSPFSSQYAYYANNASTQTNTNFAYSKSATAWDNVKLVMRTAGNGTFDTYINGTKVVDNVAYYTNSTAGSVDRIQFLLNKATNKQNSAIYFKDLVVSTSNVPTADIAAFTSTINTYASKYVSADYSATSWAAYQNALDNANTDKGVAGLKQDQANIDIQNIQAAEALLVPKATSTVVTNYLTDSASYPSANYSPVSYAPLQAAIDQLNAVNTTYDQTAADTAVAAYVAAKQNLFASPNLTNLNTAINNANALSAATYTAATWQNLQNAVAAGTAVKNSAVATQALIDTATSNITNAQAALITAAASLGDAIASAAVIVNTNYTPYSWSEFQNALTIARVANADTNASTITTNFAAAELARTQNALVTNPAGKTWNVTYIINNSTIDAQGYIYAYPNILTKVVDNTVIGTLPTMAGPYNGTFAGWNTKLDGSGATVDASTVVTGDMYVYARWTNFTIKLDPNAGTLNGSTSVQSFTVAESGKPWAMSIPTKASNVFVGWNPIVSNSNPTIVSRVFDQTVPVLPTVQSYKAQWKAGITYNANGGTLDPITPKSNVAVGTAIGLIWFPLNPTSPAGQVFTGWNTAAGGTGTQFYFGTASTTYNMNLYAQYAPASAVTFDPNGGALTGIDTTANRLGKTSILGITTPYQIKTKTGVGLMGAFGSAGMYSSMLTNPIRPGYEFAKWTTDFDGTIPFDPTIAINADTTVYAQWNKLNVVTVNANGGTYTGRNKIAIANNTSFGTSLPPIPIKDGSTFLSWNTQANGSGTTVTASTPITADTTLNAIWSSQTFNTLTADGLANTTDTTTLTIGLSVDVDLTANDVTVTGATKGTLTDNNDGTYTLAISNITVPEGGNVNVSLSKPGYAFTPASKDVVVHRASTVYTITSSAGNNGSISPSDSVAVNEGTDKTFTITPNNGYMIDTFKVDGTDSTVTNNTYTFTNVTSDHTINVTFKQVPPTIYTITATAGSNGSISPSGSFVMAEGTGKTFTITPNNGYMIDTFKVDGTDSTVTNNTYTFTNVTSDHTINVTFKQVQQTIHTITATAGSNGSISPSSSVTVIEGADQTFTITVDSGYIVDTFTVDGTDATLTNNTYTFSNVTSNHTIQVTFKPLPPNVYSVTTTSSDGGTISGNTAVTQGSDAIFTFTPDSGYLFNNLTVDGVSETVTDNTYTFTNVTSNHTIHVTFSPVPPTVYTIMATAGSNGSISPSGSVTVTERTAKSFTITANSGYMVDTFTVDGADATLTNNTYTFSSVTSAHTINVTFKQIPIVPAPPVEQKQDEPKKEDPKKVIVSKDELKKSPDADKVVIEVSKDVKEIVLPSNTAELLGQNQLSISSDQLTMNVPSDLLKQLADKAADQKDSKIVVKVEPLNEVEAQDLLAKGKISKQDLVKTGGQVFDLKLLLVSQDGAETNLTKFNKPITIRLKVSPTAKPNLSGIYYIGDNGELEFIGGKYENGEFVAEIHHFSKYAVLEFTKSFTDVASTHWAYGAIQEMASKHVVNGTSETTFEPGREITRAEFTTMLVNALNLKDASVMTFADVSSQAWYADAVSKAVQAGIVAGKDARTFDPNSSISREEMVTMMMRAYALLHADKVVASGALLFKDVDKVASWSLASVQAAASLQLINGRTADEFDPQGISTRAEAVTVLKRLLQ